MIKVKNRTSQYAFENYRPVLETTLKRVPHIEKLLIPNGLVGYFTVAFNGRCLHDVANLKIELNEFDFLAGCSGEIKESAEDFSTRERARFLVGQIDQWNDRKYWPVTILTAVLAAYVSLSSECEKYAVLAGILILLLLLLELCRVFASDQVLALREALRLIEAAESSQEQRETM